MPSRSGRSSGRQCDLARVIRSMRDAVPRLRGRSAGGLGGPGHVKQPVATAIGGVRAELVGVEQRMRDVVPPGTQGTDTATTGAPLGASRRIAVFGNVNAATRSDANKALGRSTGGPPSARGPRLPTSLADT